MTTQRQLLGKFAALVERNYAVTCVVALIPTLGCSYRTWDERVAKALAKHAKREGFAAVVQNGPSMSYLITITTV